MNTTQPAPATRRAGRGFHVCAAIAAQTCRAATGAEVHIEPMLEGREGSLVFWVLEYQRVDAVMEWLESLGRQVVIVLAWDDDTGWGVVVA